MPLGMARLGKSLVLLACMGYPWLVRSAFIAGQPAPVHLALALIPVLALGYWLVMRSHVRPVWVIMLLLAAAAVTLLGMQERWNLAVAYGIPHAAINLFLLWFFGRTLVRGREPLITRFARRLHETLAPEIEVYTRRVTLAWCFFFAAQIMLSILLFAFAPVSVWLLFISLLTFPLLALMFLGEYIYRVMRYPKHPRVSIWKAIQVFSKDFSVSRSANVR